MAARKTYDPARKDRLLRTLRREILAARLKVTLDEQLIRETSPVVKALSELRLPPIVRSVNPRADGFERRAHPTTNKDQVFATLRREILAARLKVTLDEQLGRETSQPVQALAGMTLPPINKPEPDLIAPS